MVHEYTSDDFRSGEWLTPTGRLVCRWWWNSTKEALCVEGLGFSESWNPPSALIPRVFQDLPMVAKAMADVAEAMKPYTSDDRSENHQGEGAERCT